MFTIFKNALLVALLFLATPAFASDIQLDWEATELGFFEEVNDDGIVLDGIAVYVPSSRVATKDDFRHVLPSFCESHLS